MRTIPIPELKCLYQPIEVLEVNVGLFQINWEAVPQFQACSHSVY